MASLSGTGAFVASYVGRMADAIDAMSRSVRELNSRMEVITSELAHTNRTLTDHETRLRGVERRQYK